MRTAIVLSALLAVAATQRGGCGKPPETNPAADACADLACGAECTIEPPCRSATPPCAMPSTVGHCDPKGACVPAEVSCAPSPCAGKACGESCNPCGDAHPCPTFAATACDRSGACVLLTPGLCTYDPCAGKTCGEACSVCPPGATGCAAILCVTACDARGQCACSGGAACSR